MNIPTGTPWVRPKPPTLDEFVTAFTQQVGKQLNIDLEPSVEDLHSADGTNSPSIAQLTAGLRDDLNLLLCGYAVERTVRLTNGLLSVNAEKIDKIIIDIHDSLSTLHQTIPHGLPTEIFPDSQVDEFTVRELLEHCLQDTCEKMLGDRNALSATQRKR